MNLRRLPIQHGEVSVMLHFQDKPGTEYSERKQLVYSELVKHS